MKIVISCHPTQGGSGVVATELAAALAKRGHEAHLVSWKRPFRYTEESGVIFHKVNVPDYPLFKHPPHDLSLANKLAQVCWEYNVDVIHAHYAVPHAVTALLAKQIVQPHQVRIVTTLHGTDITFVGSHSDFYDLTRHAIGKSDAVTTVSNWLRQETRTRFRLEKAPEVIPNFIDTERFHPENRLPHPGEGGELTFVHASNMRPVKRITHIIRVFNEVQKQVPAKLVLLGDGPDRGVARELVAGLGLCDRVKFNGIHKEPAEFLRNAHLFFLLSDYESFGLSALEAMACGTPSAVSAAGGLPEVVSHNETGLLCPVCPCGEAEAAKMIIDLVKDPARWNAVSECAAATVSERFAQEKIVAQYEALYERVIG